MKRRPPPGNVRWARTSGINQPGIVISKWGRIVQYESQAEQSHLLRLDRDPTVKEYTSQPEVITYLDRWDDTIKQYVPDFRVLRVDGTVELHTVTTQAQRKADSIKEREAAIERYCRERSWRYVVFDERTLPGPAERANLLALVCYRPSVYADSAVEAAAENTLVAGERRAFRELAADIESELMLAPAHVVAALGHLLWHGKLGTDLQTLLIDDATITRDAIVWLLEPAPTPAERPGEGA